MHRRVVGCPGGKRIDWPMGVHYVSAAGPLTHAYSAAGTLPPRCAYSRAWLLSRRLSLNDHHYLCILAIAV